jgi:SAM-dependent methyltransferase
MAFIPPREEWVRSHVEYVPNEVTRFCGALSDLEILDIGCGEMLSDVAFLSRGAKHVTGLDVHAHEPDFTERAIRAVGDAGCGVANDYSSRLSYVGYHGTRFPFPDNQFDLVISWSAFEHVPAVLPVLHEARRVVKPQGRVFVQVYPWFHCFWGSHLTDYIDEPYFHLRRPLEWVQTKLQDYIATHADQSEFILGHMLPEYRKLNRYSARLFIRDVMEAGFSIELLESVTRDDHVAAAPPEVPRADVIACGTFALLRPAKG